MRLVVTVKYGRSLRRVTQQRFRACTAVAIKVSATTVSFQNHGADLTGLLRPRSMIPVCDLRKRRYIRRLSLSIYSASWRELKEIQRDGVDVI